MAQSVNARAFTVASDVVFACGSYAPDSAEGRRLLAHELVHTVQQEGGTGRDWSGAGVVQRQFVTPLAAGGGFHGLMERDRRAAYGPAPLMFSYNANLDPELRERFNRMPFEMHRRGIGYTSIADVRTPQVAHIVSTGHHIRERQAIPLTDLRALPDGKDLDRNTWYDRGWEQGSTTDAQLLERCKDNALRLARQQGSDYIKEGKINCAYEGYERDNPHRRPNVPEVPVSHHVTGHAVDLSGVEWSSLGGEWSARARQFVAGFGLTRPFSPEATTYCIKEPWHFELPAEAAPASDTAPAGQ